MSSRSRRVTPKKANPPQQMQVVPQPLPEQWQLGPFKTMEGKNGIAVSIHTLNGTFVHFLSTEFAQRLADDLKKLSGAPSILVAPASALGELEAAAAQAQQTAE